VRYLEQHQGSATYLVAVNGSQTAAPFILDSGKAVIAMGGFTGTDPTPTLSEFEHLVATGEVHYVYVSSGTGGGGGTPGAGGGTLPGGTHGGGQTENTTSAVDSWVQKHGTVVSSSAYGGSSGGGTLYYVSSAAASE
jgi:4-amino-4-deoxy-L-arabinose transferase-like glycosyltransferase